MVTITNLTQKKTKLIADATELVNRGLHTAVEKEQHRKFLVEIDGVQDHIDLLSRVERGMPTPPAPAPVPVTAVPTIISETSETRRRKVNDAARHFFRNGYINPEQRDLLTTTDASGGGLVAQSFNTIFTEAAKFFGRVWNLVNRKDSTTGEPRKFVVSDDTSRTFSLIAEGSGSARASAQQPTIFSNVTATDTLASSILYSVQELDDAFDLESFLKKNAGLAVSRAWEHAISLGTSNDGTNTALPNSPSGGLLGAVTAGFSQTALANGIGYQNLVTLAGSVDHAYYLNGAYMCSPATQVLLLSQTDSTSRPLYNVDPNTGLLMINGKPLYVNASMSAYNTPSAPVLLFGDFSKTYNVLNAGGLKIKVISESQANNIDLKEMILYTRIGASAGLSTAVKAFVTAAS